MFTADVNICDQTDGNPQKADQLAAVGKLSFDQIKRNLKLN
jgi:hypothetical protein